MAVRTMPVQGKDITCSINFGGPVDGSPTFAAVDPFIQLLKSVSVKLDANVEDVTALADVFKVNVPTRLSGSVDVTVYVDSLLGNVFKNKAGQYCQIVINPNALGAETYTGLVSSVSNEYTVDGVLFQDATITLGVVGGASMATFA
jgi:hypothetical protein